MSKDSIQFMHLEAASFLRFVRTRLAPEAFHATTRALDVGSGDINGNNRGMFDERGMYIGNDMTPGPNVTIVCKTSALPFLDGTFDVVVSSECFEHDPEWRESLRAIWRMLKPRGLFFFTCAGEGRPEHGTRRTSSSDSFATAANLEVWSDYYMNLSPGMVMEQAFRGSMGTHFSTWAFYTNTRSKDLYFWGFKVGGEGDASTPETYSGPDIVAGPHGTPAWMFVPGLDSVGGDICTVEASSIAPPFTELRAAYPTAVGVNTLGYVKYAITWPLVSSALIDKVQDGLFIFQ